MFTHGWCRHLFAQHPSLLQANVTQPTAQNAPATLLNTVELGFSVWGEERDAKIAMLKIIFEITLLSFFFFLNGDYLENIQNSKDGCKQL